MPKKASSKNLASRDKDYQNLVSDLKSIITKGQYEAYKTVDNIRVQTYWQLGERIVREELKEVFKETYDFRFIELRSEPKEKELEKKILDNFEKFLKELGQDFAILGRQVPIKIDQQMHSIDMVA